MDMSSEKTTPNDTLLTVKDVARRLGVRPAKVYEMERNQTGPRSVRLGKLIKYRREAVEQWLVEQEQCQRAEESSA